MQNKRGNNKQDSFDQQNKIQLFQKHASEKRHIISQAKRIERLCDYEGYDNAHQECEWAMKELQQRWKSVGSAGREEEVLWESFCAVKDRFWKGIKIAKLHDRISDLCFELDNLRDDFEFTHKAYLIDLIDRKEDKIMDLQWEIEQIEKELGIY